MNLEKITKKDRIKIIEVFVEKALGAYFNKIDMEKSDPPASEL